MAEGYMITLTVLSRGDDIKDTVVSGQERCALVLWGHFPLYFWETVSLPSLGRWTHRNSPASVSPVLGVQVYATTPGWGHFD